MVCEPAAFKVAAMQSEKLMSKVMRYEQSLFAQAQQSVACKQIMKLSPGFAAGYFAPAICREAITFYLRRAGAPAIKSAAC